MKCDILVNDALKASYTVDERDFIAGVIWIRDPHPKFLPDWVPAVIHNMIAGFARLIRRRRYGDSAPRAQIHLVAGFSGGRERRFLAIPIWTAEPHQRLTGVAVNYGDVVRIRVAGS